MTQNVSQFDMSTKLICKVHHKQQQQQHQQHHAHLLCLPRSIRFVRKRQTLTDTWCQFYQHFMRAFFANIFEPKITMLKCSALRLFGERILAK